MRQRTARYECCHVRSPFKEGPGIGCLPATLATSLVIAACITGLLIAAIINRIICGDAASSARYALQRVCAGVS